MASEEKRIYCEGRGLALAPSAKFARAADIGSRWFQIHQLLLALPYRLLRGLMNIRVSSTRVRR